MSDFIYRTISVNLPSYQNAKEYNLFKKENNLVNDNNGCDSVVVSIEACGASGPGSNPGRGPKPFSKRFAKKRICEANSFRKGFKGFCYTQSLENVGVVNE